MIARAPGKVVISGAYGVLYGAPAIVSAVDRYVTADSRETADFVTPEVRAALGDAPAPRFDASALRQDGQKLGLGSSAAILVASLAARYPHWLATSQGKEQLLITALAAHRTAQGGGSGIDVLSSVHGGTLTAKRDPLDDKAPLDFRHVSLPQMLFIEVWRCPSAAQTHQLIGKVSLLHAKDRPHHEALIADLTKAAEHALFAVESDNAAGFIQALNAQASGLEALGNAAEAPIVTPELARLIARGSGSEIAILPAGAGGGDIALYVGLAPPSVEIVELARSLDHNPLTLRLGARGAQVEGFA